MSALWRELERAMPPEVGPPADQPRAFTSLLTERSGQVNLGPRRRLDGRLDPREPILHAVRTRRFRAAALPLVIRLLAAGLAPVVPQVVTSGTLKSPWWSSRCTAISRF